MFYLFWKKVARLSSSRLSLQTINDASKICEKFKAESDVSKSKTRIRYKFNYFKTFKLFGFLSGVTSTASGSCTFSKTLVIDRSDFPLLQFFQ